MRLIMVDPKMPELSIYEGIPQSVGTGGHRHEAGGQRAHWCVTEMEKRYKLMSAMGATLPAWAHQDQGRREEGRAHPESG